MENEILFEEKQVFNRWLVGIIGCNMCGIFVFGLYSQIVLKKDFGNHPAPNFMLVLFLCLMLALMISFFMMTLKTKITATELTVQFFPFHLSPRIFKWTEMKTVYIRKYDPIFEYGGWGLKGLGDNCAWNVSGYTGIQIEFKNGKKLLVGTNKKEELSNVLNTLNLTAKSEL